MGGCASVLVEIVICFGGVVRRGICESRFFLKRGGYFYIMLSFEMRSKLESRTLHSLAEMRSKLKCRPLHSLAEMRVRLRYARG
jgi:hypothetical protein